MKILKKLAIVSVMVIILTVLLSTVAMAAGPNPDPGVCPNSNCPNECLSGDCVCDGDQLQSQQQNGAQSQKGNIYQFQYRSCQID